MSRKERSDKIHIAAKNVYLVGGAQDKSQIDIKFNNQPITDTGSAGSDVKNSRVTIQLSNLYRIASFNTFTNGILELDIPQGVNLNTFTFGN
jgi:hypothetical protein